MTETEQEPFSKRRARHQSQGASDQKRLAFWALLLRYGDSHTVGCLDAPDLIPTGQTVWFVCMSEQFMHFRDGL